jgi:mitogen-activated protein kinase kinase kinase
VTTYGLEVHRDLVYIFMEYCSGGSIAQRLEAGPIKDKEWIRHRAVEILRGLQWLHGLSIEHRDVKPSNILLDAEDHAKLIDFGACNIIAYSRRTRGINVATKASELVGTPLYMAPEVVTGNPKHQIGSQDIWALGISLVEMFEGISPFGHLDNAWAIMYHIATKAPTLPDTSPVVLDFLNKCFTRDHEHRPTATQLLAHPWLQGG